MQLETVPARALKPSAWVTTNHVLRPDYKLLRKSLEEHGWLVPLVVNDDRTIIDGYHRWMIAMDNKLLGDAVPVKVVQVDESDAMILHIALNRTRGVVVNKHVSRLVKALLRGGKYEPEELRLKLNMSADEFDLLADGTLIKMRNVKEHRYSKAWVPVETSGREVGQGISIERPPNKDA